ncbi:MAG: endopeptidase La [Armatimonadia bacterium]|nr:endopeptidase La [Armatimonadia bacterium]
MRLWGSELQDMEQIEQVINEEVVGGPSIPDELPVVRLLNGVIFPGMLAPLTVTNPLDIELIDEALSGNRMIGLVAQRDADADRPGPEGLYNVGLVALIQKMIQLPNGDRRLLVRGLSRARVTEWTQIEPWLRARVEEIEEPEEVSEDLRARNQALLDLLRRLVEMAPHLPEEIYIQALNLEHPGSLADMMASLLDMDIEERQQILETIDLDARLRQVMTLTTREIQQYELTQRMQQDARNELSEAQREYFLRQQLKAIQEELGEGEEQRPDLVELKEKVEEAKMTEEAREAAERELERLENMNPAAAEYNVARTYVEWLTEVPWVEASETRIDIEEAQTVLDEDHYDLEDVKERIIEYLAVRKLREEIKGPILCFVGPPGVGKTSLGKSIARATGREFHRISLGGVRDEAEIRGHRRTYVGALPGRIIQGLKRVGVNNPIFMLDEIDKLGTGAGFRGDPSSAMLEVLDPEQNDTFSDHYLEVPCDLSNVIFITTANVLETIPAPLLDRMEVIRLPGYTLKEKLHIAKRYLVPRQREEHGLTSDQFSISDAALEEVIDGYTREAGVRNLERQIGALARKIARKVSEGDESPPNVSMRNLENLLGPRLHYSEVAQRTGQPGVVCGLAWTQAGGDILFIEATKMPGKNNLTLTGQLGDVMKESGRAAMSWVRAHAEELGIDPDFYENTDIHLHVPAGAVPKDGPSAGVAMVTAIASLLSERTVKPNVGMTGEITLRGKVLPIGGVKEKIVAAKSSGLDTVILPARNEAQVEEISKDHTQGMTFIYADEIEDVLGAALE